MQNFLLFLLFFCNLFSKTFAEQIYQLTDVNNIEYLGKYCMVYEDPSGKLSVSKIMSNKDYKTFKKPVLNFGTTNSTFLIKINIQNKCSYENLVLNFEYPLTDKLEFYEMTDDSVSLLLETGDSYKFNSRIIYHQDYLIPLTIHQNEIKTYLIKVSGGDHIIIPLSIGIDKVIYSELLKKDILFGICFGVLIVMVLYNFFIYINIRDNIYLIYVFYILFMLLTQTTIACYGFKYLWPSIAEINDQLFIIFPSIASMLIVLFAQKFMLIKTFKPLFSKWLYYFYYSYPCAIIATLLNQQKIALAILDINALLISFPLIYIAFAISKKGHKPARFFLFGWSVAFFGFFFFALRNIGILEFNGISNYTMPAGIAIESIVFSIALANRINVLRKENEQKQQEIIKHLKANEEFTKITQELKINAEKLKKEIISTEFEALKNQVNPHFLFNSLNVLTELVYQSRDQAADFIKKLSEVYRYVLDNKNKEVVSLKTELDFIESFAFLLKIRFDKNLSISINIQEPDNIYIPPLTLQLLVENATKHNIISEEQPLSINIYDKVNYIIVENNLQAKQQSDISHGIGLQNIKNRYAMLSNQQVVIEKTNNIYTVKMPKLIK